MKIEISPKKILSILMSIIGLLVILNLVVVVIKFVYHHDFAKGFVPLFDLDGEKNVPSFFSALELIISSALLFLIAFGRKNLQINYLRWLGLSLIFLFLSLDEIASIHELLVRPLRRELHTSGIFYFAWVIPYGAILIGLAVTYLKFWLNLPKKTKNMFAISAIVYVTGALGLEMIGGFYANIYGQKSLGYGLLYTVEETLEMTGMALFIYTLTDYISCYFPLLSIYINARALPPVSLPELSKIKSGYNE